MASNKSPLERCLLGHSLAAGPLNTWPLGHWVFNEPEWHKIFVSCPPLAGGSKLILRKTKWWGSYVFMSLLKGQYLIHLTVSGMWDSCHENIQELPILLVQWQNALITSGWFRDFALRKGKGGESKMSTRWQQQLRFTGGQQKSLWHQLGPALSSVTHWCNPWQNRALYL